MEKMLMGGDSMQRVFQLMFDVAVMWRWCRSRKV